MKSIICTFLVFSIATVSQCQNKELDSLYVLLKNHPQKDTARLSIIFTICYQEYLFRPDKNKTLAEEALEISEELNFPQGIATANGAMALYYWAIGDYEQATRHTYTMLRVSEQIQFQRGIGQSYQLLAIIHQLHGEFEKSLSFYAQALAIYKKENLTKEIGSCLNLTGTLYMKYSKFDLASECFLEALEIRKEMNDENGANSIYGNLASMYLLKGEYVKALKYFDKALQIVVKLNNRFRMVVLHMGIGELYTRTGEYDKAELHLFKSIAIAKAINQKKQLEEAYNKLTILEKRRRRSGKALMYFELATAYSDSIYSEEKAKKLAELETSYEAEKKDKRIVSLEQQKKTQNLKQFYLILGILLVSLTSLIIYLLQRTHNKKVNILFETQQLLNLKLQETDQLKSRLFANISHEFRTPLSLILAPMEEKLASPGLTSSEKESVLRVRRNANRLLVLVNQLLDLSKLEAGKMELFIQQGDVGKFLKIIAASFDSLAENKKIHFNKRIHAGLTEGWYDADKLEKIVNNVLFNAFKFTPQDGTVTLSVSTLPETHDLEITIADTGKGIPEGEQQHIFSAFYQSRYTADDGSGSGLGLSLVKELVKLYGGSVELVSHVGKGTTFLIVLPVEKEKFQPEALVHNAAPGKGSVEFYTDALLFSIDQNPEESTETETEVRQPDSLLIVEDNDDLRNYISSIMKNQFAIINAKDGEEGFSLALEHIPALIITDVMMPKLNGIDLTEKIKTDERTSHIPVVLLTAKADLDSRLEGLRTGADDYLAKPFSTSELQVRIDNLIGQRKKLAAKYRATLSASPSPLSPHEPSLDEKFLKKVRDVVEKNMDDSNFGVEQLAAEIHMSRTQLFRKLKGIVTLSPNEFINDIRLLRAAELIRAKADTLAQISYSVGFSEQSYFAKRFRRKFGVNPSEYQAKGPALK